MDFIALIHPKRQDFAETMTSQERAVMAEHDAYIAELFRQGTIVISGESPESGIGMVIYRVDSAAEARRYFYNDPAVLAGIGYPHLYPFQIRNLMLS